MTNFVPNEQQAKAIELGKQWWKEGANRPFILTGMAGTGKTTNARKMLDALGLHETEIALAAPTGKAARVLAHKTKLETSTIHGLIYSVKKTKADDLKVKYAEELAKGESHYDENILSDLKHDIEELSERNPQFTFNNRIDTQKALLIDEGSMIGEDIWEDLLQVDIPKIIVYDPFQLPPVKQKFPLENIAADVFLTQIMRQSEGSGIAQAAADIRFGRPLKSYGEDFKIIPKGVLTINDYAKNYDLIISGTNSLRQILNKSIRRTFGYPPDTPVAGDKVMMLSNHRDTGLSNGEVLKIKRVVWKTKYTIRLNLVDEFGTEFPGVTAYLPIFNDEKNTRSAPHGLALITYGYCLTAHKSQGSEAERVCVLDDWRGADYDRWLYTAVTRASKVCHFVTDQVCE